MICGRACQGWAEYSLALGDLLNAVSGYLFSALEFPKSAQARGPQHSIGYLTLVASVPSVKRAKRAKRAKSAIPIKALHIHAKIGAQLRFPIGAGPGGQNARMLLKSTPQDGTFRSLRRMDSGHRFRLPRADARMLVISPNGPRRPLALSGPFLLQQSSIFPPSPCPFPSVVTSSAL